MLPELNGFEVCRILRKEITTPIIIVSARDDEIDRINGLEAGADDYASKPFSMRELLARVRAILRRSTWAGDRPHIASKIDRNNPSLPKKTGFYIDEGRHKAYHHGIELQLSPKEFDLLSFLNNNHGIVFSRDILLEKLWGLDYNGTPRTVDVHIRSLRQKIEKDSQNPEHLITVHGYGYKFI